MVVTDGPVDPRSRLFVGRAEELKTLETWLANIDCVGAVMGARQTGKTSLLFKLRHRLQRKYAFAFIDLQSVEGADIAECFTFIAAELRDQLADYCSRSLLLPGDAREFLTFLRDLSKDASAVRIILILDEVGALPPKTAMKLASTIRALFTNRLIKPEFARYVVLLAGATDMLDLTAGRNSPLRNVTESIYLKDLSVSETEQLLAKVLGRARLKLSPEITDSLHGWTGGHPYWTQLLAGVLEHPSQELSDARLTSIVEGLLPTEDKNLPHVFKSLEGDLPLWNMVESLLDGTSIAFSRANPAVARLELIGLVKNQNGHCAIRNKIYSEAIRRQHTKPRRYNPSDLRKLSQAFGAATGRRDLLKVAAEELRRLLQNRNVMVFDRTPDHLHYSPIASAGIAPEGSTRAKFPSGSPLTGLLESAFEPALAALSESDQILFQELRSAFVVPLRHKEQCVGFFSLGRKLSNEPYDQHDVEFVAAVAEQAVASLERLRLSDIERDAEQARAIQEALLPKSMPKIDGVQIAAGWRPARIVAGDYYDLLELPDDKLALCIGDVVGKGMPAALMMANLQAAVKALASGVPAPQMLCQELNRRMAGNISLGKFITFFYGVLDIRARRFVYTNAGHNPPILVRADGQTRRLHEGGALLGVLPDWCYQQEEIDLADGDRLLLFTDGASEAQNGDGEEFSEERLVQLMTQHRDLDATSLERKVFESVALFSGGNFHDDVTTVVLALGASAVD